MDKNATIDNFTWSAFLKGDKDAYAVVYREYFSRLYNYGMRFTQDITLVEDCIQDLLLTLWVKRNNLENIAGVDSYIFVSFRNNLLYCIQKSPDTNNVDNENNYTLNCKYL